MRFVSLNSSFATRRGLRRLAWWPIAALLVALCAYAKPTSAPPSRRSAPFDHAEQLRADLESRPEAQRTKRQYERVLDAYRAIYHGDPAASKADDSINAVAELLAEEGRVLHSEKRLLDAAGQYEFLRKQYPYSRYRFSALIAEGTIYRRDLGDRDQAKAKFEEFVKTYPKHPLAAQARAELKEIRQEEIAEREKGHPLTPPAAVKAADVTEQAAAAPLLSTAAADPTPLSRHGQMALVTRIRHWSTPVYTRIAINLNDQVQYEAARVPHPDRIYFDLHDAHLASDLVGKSVTVTDGGFLKKIRAAQYSGNVTRIVLDVSSVADYSAFFLPNPWRLIIDIHGRAPDQAAAKEIAGAAPSPPAEEVDTLGQQPDRVRATRGPTTRPIAAIVAGAIPAPQTESPTQNSQVAASNSTSASRARRTTTSAAARPPTASPAAGNLAGESASEDESDLFTARAAHPTSDGERSLVRTLGLKIGRIVIDPGHGGHDCGTLGPGGIEEKDVVLDVALRLGRLLKQRLGEDVIYTRDDDTFIPLEERTAIANKARADLFISIHANSSRDRSARGVESYYLNFTTSPDALEVAARENAVSDESIYELSDLVKKIALKDKIEESREFAADVQRSLYDGLERGNPGLKDRGVKKAPFVVLIGANMPSILAEISFLTNPRDARELHDAAYRERIAESLYRGIARYINGLSGIRVAENPSSPGVH